MGDFLLDLPEPNLPPLEGLLERFGSEVDLSWNRLKASRATLGVFWIVLGRLQVENMILFLPCLTNEGGRLRLKV